MKDKMLKTRNKLIDDIVERSIKEYGEGSTFILSSKNISSIVSKTISTGSPELDRILAKDTNGKYGMPVGRIVGVSGKEASGKTTLLIMLMKATQKIGGVAALIETEHAFDPSYAKKLGLNIDELVLSQPRYLEEGLDMIELFIEMFKKSKEKHIKDGNEKWDVPMFIGFDSIAGIGPKAEYEADSYDNEQALGLHARRLSKFFRNISGKIAKEQICLVCTNQLKTNTGVRFGNKDTEIGGAALKFHASLRLDIRQSGLIKLTKDSDPIGINVAAKTVKNKCMLPYKKIEVPLYFGEGFCYHESLFNVLLLNNIIKKEKNTYILKYKIKDKEHILRVAYGDKFIKELKKLTDSPRIRSIIEKKLDKKLEKNEI